MHNYSVYARTDFMGSEDLLQDFFINFSGYVNLLQDILTVINVFIASILAKHFKLNIF